MSTRRTDYEQHGQSRSRLYRVWQNIHKRCTCETDETYQKYGAKGITLCDEWKNSFRAFQEWAYANGYDENAPSGKCTIDRIDNAKGYSPDNCRWVDRVVQQNNRSVNHRVVIDGISKTIAEWSKISGIEFNRIYKRLKKGWDAKDAVFKPIDMRYSHAKTKSDENFA